MIWLLHGKMRELIQTALDALKPLEALQCGHTWCLGCSPDSVSKDDIFTLTEQNRKTLMKQLQYILDEDGQL